MNFDELYRGLKELKASIEMAEKLATNEKNKSFHKGRKYQLMVILGWFEDNNEWYQKIIK